MTYLELTTPPDAALIQSDSLWAEMRRAEGPRWAWHDAEVAAEPNKAGLAVSLRAEKTAVSRVALIWNRSAPPGARILGDCWERGYGDLEWRGIVPERVMPWYFLLYDGRRTHGFGVMTGPAALCFWQVSEEAVTLCLDVRCGGEGVLLGGRKIQLATVMERRGQEGETPFAAARAFCGLLCPAPALPPSPVYGGNNWYYAYGRSSNDEILAESEFISRLAPAGGNRPFMVIDDCWAPQLSARVESLWRQGNERFPDMARLAEQMRGAGVRPGIWMRPLRAPDGAPEALCLPAERLRAPVAGKYLDPSMPEALERVRADVAQIRQWGYGLIKHDFSTFDLLGRWGFEMGGHVTGGGWHFYDRARTTAEIIGALYRAIREAAGGALIIGCNTVGHIGAGIFEMQRTGDDTSGRQWERTRKMGVNTLAFGMPKHGAFYAADADCAAVTDAIPWELSRQWLTLLAGSGTPLFVSAPASTGGAQQAAIRAAFEAAAAPQAPAEPLDWMDTTCPRAWKLGGGSAQFHWHRLDTVDFCEG